jgi:hypothetical protein
MSQTNTRTLSRPAQGNNSTPVKPPRLSFESDSGALGPVVGRGTVSRPTPLKRWSPKAQSAPKITRR